MVVWIALLLLIILGLLFFEKLQQIVLHLMHAAHSFADEYNKVYREDSDGEDEQEQETKINQEKKRR